MHINPGFCKFGGVLVMEGSRLMMSVINLPVHKCVNWIEVLNESLIVIHLFNLPLGAYETSYAEKG